MKVIVKYKTVRKKLDVPDNLSSYDLLQKAVEIHNATGNLTLSFYKKEVSLSKKVKELELASGDMLELIEDKNNQLVEALLAINEYSSRDEFKQALLERGVMGGADYLFVAFHANMLRLGFTTTDSATKKPLDNLPKDWKIAIGFYKMCFTYKNRKKISVECTGSVTGKTMSINGVLTMEDTSGNTNSEMETDSDSDNDHEPCNLRLKISDYISGAVDTYEPKKIYKNVMELDRKISKEFGLKLVEEIEERMINQPTLLSLPSHILVRVIQNLEVKDIAQVARVSKKINEVTNQESLWKNVLLRQLNITNPEKLCYKEAVKEIIELKRAKEKEKKERDRREKEFLDEQELKRARHQTPRRPEFEPSYHHQGVYPDTSIPVRGIIGGAQDLYPHMRNQPGDFRGIGIPGHAGPDLIPGRSFRAPMGARYDPMGSIPDDDFRPGRQNMHPDLMRRPGFGSYFDGGGFI